MHPAECNKQKRNKPNATSEKQQAKRRNATSKNALSRGKKHTHWPYAPPSSPPTLPTPPPRLQCKIKPASGFRLQVTGCRPRATYSTDCKATAYRVHAPSYRLGWAPGYEQQSAGSSRPTDCRPRPTSYRRQATGHRQQTTGYKLQAVHQPTGLRATEQTGYMHPTSYASTTRQKAKTPQGYPPHRSRINTNHRTASRLGTGYT